MSGMNVRVNPKMAEFVEQELANGDYASASDVVDEALSLLQHERGKLETLRREIALGLADADAGRFSDRTAADIARSMIAGRDG